MSTQRFAHSVALALVMVAATAAAQDASPTLKRIQDNGEIVLGVRDASVPFSYLDDKQQQVGYSVELCLRVAEAVKVALKRPELRVRYNPVTSANRIPLIANGTIDIECGSTVNNIERQKQVAFSYTTYVVSTKFVARRENQLKTLSDLKGKTVVCTAGTNTFGRVNELNAKYNLGMTIVTGKDHAESMLMMESGRAAAFFEDDILLMGLVANSRNPADFALGSEAYSIDPYALMLPRGDAGFKRMVDATLSDTFKSGAIMPIYAKWFEKPIPPKGVTLSVPMSPALKQAIARPTDSPEPAAYQ